MENKIPKKQIGVRRFQDAFFYSLSGLKIAFVNEAAFRQELVLFIILAIALIFLPLPIMVKMLLLLANTLVLVVELLNSALEEVTDLVSPNYHQLAKNAKDIASGAVFMMLLMVSVLWGFSLIVYVI